MPISTGTSGAVSELVVSADLMLRGYHVFRALSPSCPCDLVVLADTTACRVEVRTGKRGARGVAYCGFTPADEGRFDVLAIVLREEGRIEYRPSIEGWLAGERFDRASLSNAVPRAAA